MNERGRGRNLQKCQRDYEDHVEKSASADSTKKLESFREYRELQERNLKDRKGQVKEGWER